MGPKMLTEHAQMHAGKCEGVKHENPKGEGKLGNENYPLTITPPFSFPYLTSPLGFSLLTPSHFPACI